MTNTLVYVPRDRPDLVQAIAHADPAVVVHTYSPKTDAVAMPFGTQVDAMTNTATGQTKSFHDVVDDLMTAAAKCAEQGTQGYVADAETWARAALDFAEAARVALQVAQGCP